MCAICDVSYPPDKIIWKEITKSKPRLWKIKRLLRISGANPNATTRSGAGVDTLLHKAVRMNDFTIVDMLIIHGARLEEVAYDGTTALGYACLHSQKKIVTFLVEMGYNLSHVMPGGETILTWIVKDERRWPSLPDLLQSIARSEKERLEGVNKDGLNCLQIVIRDGLRGAWDILTQYGFPIDAPTSQGSPSLHFACTISKPRAVRRLLEEGGSIAGRDKLRRTPLLVAVIVRSAECTKVLLEYILNLPKSSQRARLNDYDVDGNTAVHYGTCNARGGQLELLLGAGCNPDTLNKKGLAAMHIAATEGNAKTMSILIEGGADVEVADVDGRTAMHRALARGYGDVVRLLLAAGASSIGSDTMGVTPLMAAKVNYWSGKIGHRILQDIHAVERTAEANRELQQTRKRVKSLNLS